MTNSSVLLRPFEGYHSRGHVEGIAEANPNVAPVIDRLSDHGITRNGLLDCYLEGWAEANLVKILAATSPPTLRFPRSIRWKFFAVVVG